MKEASNRLKSMHEFKSCIEVVAKTISKTWSVSWPDAAGGLCSKLLISSGDGAFILFVVVVVNQHQEKMSLSSFWFCLSNLEIWRRRKEGLQRGSFLFYLLFDVRMSTLLLSTKQEEEEGRRSGMVAMQCFTWIKKKKKKTTQLTGCLLNGVVCVCWSMRGV